MKGQHWVLSKYILNNAADERVTFCFLYMFIQMLSMYWQHCILSINNAVYGIAALCYLHIINAVDTDSVYVCI